MAVVINGSGTVTGISVGGLPDGIVDSGTLATNSVDSAELIDGSIDTAHIAADQITSAILPTGSVLQVVQGTHSSPVYNNTTTYTDTGLSATITPSSSSNKILVITTSPGMYKSYILAASAINLKILRGSTTIQTITGLNFNNATHQLNTTVSMSVLDSPATTSATTYKTQFAGTDTAGTHSNVNNNDATIILMEIAG